MNYFNFQYILTYMQVMKDLFLQQKIILILIYSLVYLHFFSFIKMQQVFPIIIKKIKTSLKSGCYFIKSCN